MILECNNSMGSNNSSTKFFRKNAWFLFRHPECLDEAAYDVHVMQYQSLRTPTWIDRLLDDWVSRDAFYACAQDVFRGKNTFGKAAQVFMRIRYKSSHDCHMMREVIKEAGLRA